MTITMAVRSVNLVATTMMTTTTMMTMVMTTMTTTMMMVMTTMIMTTVRKKNHVTGMRIVAEKRVSMGNAVRRLRL